VDEVDGEDVDADDDIDEEEDVEGVAVGVDVGVDREDEGITLVNDAGGVIPPYVRMTVRHSSLQVYCTICSVKQDETLSSKMDVVEEGVWRSRMNYSGPGDGLDDDNEGADTEKTQMPHSSTRTH
jgi:hypothetical protein